MVKIDAYISISDPWDLAGIYSSMIQCVVYNYSSNIPGGTWKCLADTDVGIIIDGKEYSRFRVSGRHIGVFPRKEEMTPAGFSLVDREEGFIGALILSEDFPELR